MDEIDNHPLPPTQSHVDNPRDKKRGENIEVPSTEGFRLSPIRKFLVLVVLAGAQFFDVYTSSAVITALPTLSKDLEFSDSATQWIVSGYTLTFAAFMLISGRLGDIFHPKPVFVAGFLIVGVLSIPIGASVNPIMIIVLRAVQGIGAAMNTPTAVAMVSTSFPDLKERNSAFAVYGACGAIGNIAGFLLGGVLTAKLSWRWVFYLLAIIDIPFALSSWFILPPHQNRHEARKIASVDWLGVSTVTAGLVLFVFALSESSSAGWPTVQVLVPLILSVLLLAGFLIMEHIVKEPALPPRTWSNKNVIPLFFFAWSVYWWLLGTQVQFVEVFMDLWGMSAISAAVHCLPIGVTGGICVLVVGHYGPKIPRKPLLISGQLLMAVGSVLLALGADSAGKYWSYLVPGMIVGNVGLASAYIGCTIAMMEGARKGEEGVVGAMLYTSYQVGATIGLAVLSSITIGVNDRLGGSPASDGYQASFWSLVGMNSLLMVLAIALVRN